MTHDEAVAHVRRSEDCDRAKLQYVCDMADAAKRLAEFVQEEVADQTCLYGDDCTNSAMAQRRHGKCLPCKARAALAAMPKEPE